MMINILLWKNVLQLLIIFLISYGVLLFSGNLIATYKRSRVLDRIAGCSKTARHWLFGHILEYKMGTSEELKLINGRPKKFPTMHTLWFSPISAILQLYHPSSAGPVLKSNPSATSKDSIVYRLAKPWIGNGLVTSDGELWARHRKMLTPAFHFNMLRNYAKVFNSCSKILIEKLLAHAKEGHPVEILRPVSLMTTDAMLKCAMSIESSCQTAEPSDPTVQYVNAVQQIEANILKRVRNPLLRNDWIFGLTPTGRKQKEVLSLLHGYSERIIAERKQQRLDQVSSTDARPKDFLDILLDARDEKGNQLNDLEIRSEVDTFLFAGHDTTSSAISWTLYHLAKYPEMQRKCREEVMSIVKESDDFEWGDLSKLEYLTMFIKESMRVLPPVAFIARKVNEDITVSNSLLTQATIPRGTECGFAITTQHNSEILWSEPDKFDPERFSASNRGKIPSLAFVPFSAGSRNCIGQQFAMNELKITLGQILRKFELYTDDDTPKSIPIPLLVIKGKDGIHIKLKLLS